MCHDVSTRETIDACLLTEDKYGEKGLYKADTLEELCDHMGADVEAVKQSIEHYNELCANGVDLDFGKDSQYMSAVETPPFYGARLCPGLAAINGGLAVDEHHQVIDENREPIPGLFAVGTCGGDLCGGINWIMPNGASNAHCYNAGRYAVIYAITGDLVPSRQCSFDQIADNFREPDGRFLWEIPGALQSAVEAW